jgi:hypothetical protein
MIIFARTIKWNLWRKTPDMAMVVASVSVDNGVYIDVTDLNNPHSEGILLPPDVAEAFARAIMRAASGSGVPAGPSNPGTSDE